MLHNLSHLLYVINSTQNDYHLSVIEMEVALEYTSNLQPGTINKQSFDLWAIIVYIIYIFVGPQWIFKVILLNLCSGFQETLFHHSLKIHIQNQVVTFRVIDLEINITYVSLKLLYLYS